MEAAGCPFRGPKTPNEGENTVAFERCESCERRMDLENVFQSCNALVTSLEDIVYILLRLDLTQKCS